MSTFIMETHAAKGKDRDQESSELNRHASLRPTDLGGGCISLALRQNGLGYTTVNRVV